MKFFLDGNEYDTRKLWGFNHSKKGTLHLFGFEFSASSGASVSGWYTEIDPGMFRRATADEIERAFGKNVAQKSKR